MGTAIQGSAGIDGGLKVSVAGLVVLALSACSSGATTAMPTAQKTHALHGTVYGGRQPIGGSEIDLYQAGLNPGDAATQIAQTTSDASGNFSIDSTNPVPADGQLLYIVVSGGDAGSGPNSDIRLMSLLGGYNTPSFPDAINIDELTTVASTAVLQNNITLEDCGLINGNNASTANCVAIAGVSGLSSRAASIANLVDVASGAPSPFLTSAADGTPLNLTLRKLNTLADLVANCVNSTGGVAGDGSACGNLFSVVKPAGDTLSASFQIASSPVYNAKSTELYGLVALPEVYGPTVTSAPANWTVGGRRFTYAANNGTTTVSAYVDDPVEGALIAVPGSPFTVGTAPRNVAVVPNGRFAYVSNPPQSTISAFTIDPATGALTAVAGSPFPVTPDTGFSNSTGPMGMVFENGSRFAYVELSGNAGSGAPAADVLEYQINAISGALTAVANPGGLLLNTDCGNGVAATNPVTEFFYAACHNLFYAMPINPTDGTLGTATNAFGVSTPNALVVDPAGLNAYEVGTTGTTANYTVFGLGDPSGPQAHANVSDGTSTPYSVTIDPTAKFVYIVDSQGDIKAFNSVSLSSIATLTSSSGPRSIIVEPSGHYAYVADAGTSDIAAYEIDPNAGTLTPVGQLDPTASEGVFTSPATALDPGGKFLFVADSVNDLVDTNGIDTFGGALSFLTNAQASQGPNSVAVDPTGKYAYASQGQGTLLGYSVDAGSGQPRGLLNSPYSDPTVGYLPPIAVIAENTGRFVYLLVSDGSRSYVETYSIHAASGANPDGTNFSAGDLASMGETRVGTASVATSATAIAADPSAHLLFVSDQTSGLVYSFLIDAITGLPVAVDQVSSGGSDPSAIGVSAADGSGNVEVYVTATSNGSGTVTALQFSSTGTYASSGGSGLVGAMPNAVAISPSGRLLYVGSSSGIAGFNIGASGISSRFGGTPSPFFTGTTTFGTQVDPTGRFLDFVDTTEGHVKSALIDPSTGLLTAVALSTTYPSGSSPVAVVVSP